VATLQELLDIEGVVAVGEFNRDGTLVDFEAEMDLSVVGRPGAPSTPSPAHPRLTSSRSSGVRSGSHAANPNARGCRRHHDRHHEQVG
jgi:hypothetical protein